MKENFTESPRMIFRSHARRTPTQEGGKWQQK
nr:MAG TPA: hypothetical protein [Caudoviricetes sp.]